MHNERRHFVPVKEGQELDVKISAIGIKGDGIAKVKGFVLVISEAKENEEVHVKVTKVLRKVAFADLLGPAQGPVEEEGHLEQEDNSE